MTFALLLFGGYVPSSMCRWLNGQQANARWTPLHNHGGESGAGNTSGCDLVGITGYPELESYGKTLEEQVGTTARC